MTEQGNERRRERLKCHLLGWLFFSLIFFHLSLSSYSRCLVPELLWFILWACVCRAWRLWFWGKYQIDDFKNMVETALYKESLGLMLCLLPQAAFLLLTTSLTDCTCNWTPPKAFSRSIAQARPVGSGPSPGQVWTDQGWEGFLVPLHHQH